MKNVLLVGLGRFGLQIARKLDELGHQVMAIDIEEKRVKAVLPYARNAQIGDCTDADYISSLGIRNFDVCIVAIGDHFQASLEVTSLLKDLGAVFVVSRATSEVHAKFLQKIGADKVVYPEEQIASWTAIRYTSDHILDYIELDENHGIFELSVPNEWNDKTVGQLEIRKKYKINIMGTKKQNKLNLDVSADTILSDEITMLVSGNVKDIHKCFHI